MDRKREGEPALVFQCLAPCTDKKTWLQCGLYVVVVLEDTMICIHARDTVLGTGDPLVALAIADVVTC
jgi:hypothetical protein